MIRATAHMTRRLAGRATRRLGRRGADGVAFANLKAACEAT
jgi:hypothetical protein